MLCRSIQLCRIEPWTSPPTNRWSVHQGISCSLVHISIRKQLFCHDEQLIVGHTSVSSTPPLFNPLGCCRNRYSIFFYYQIIVGTSCPGCNGWEYICFVDTPPNHPCATRKMLYVFIDQNLKWMSCVWWRNRHADAVCINHEILFSRLASPPQLALERYPTTLILSINLCYIYSHVCSASPDLGVDAVDIGIVTPLGNIAILVSCSADSVSVNYLHLQLLLLNNLEPWWSLKSPPSWL